VGQTVYEMISFIFDGSRNLPPAIKLKIMETTTIPAMRKAAKMAGF
jgi:hypothetical protein